MKELEFVRRLHLFFAKSSTHPLRGAKIYLFYSTAIKQDFIFLLLYTPLLPSLQLPFHSGEFCRETVPACHPLRCADR